MKEKDDLNNFKAGGSSSEKVSVSNSFEESEISQIQYWARLTPEQRFADFYELMNRFYTLNKPDWTTKKINIDLGNIYYL